MTYISKNKMFPSIKREKFATHRGNFYALYEDSGKWRKIEFYLPASPTTYGFETMVDCANNFLDRLESGEKKRKTAITDNGAYDKTCYFRNFKNWFPDAV